MLDILSTVIAFVTVVLLLSLVVATAAHAVQTLLRVRARTLESGLTRFLSRVTVPPDTPNAERTAQRVVRDGQDKPDTLGAKLAGPAMRWLTSDELVKALEEEGAPAAWLDAARSDFGRLERELEAAFALKMKWIAFGIGLAVAAYYQVSTPELLSRLSADRALRERVASFESQIEDRAKRLERTTIEKDAAPAALEQLIEAHKGEKDLADALRKVDVADTDAAAARARISAALPAAHASRAGALADEFDRRVRDREEAEVAKRKEELRETASVLAQIDLRPWAGGWEWFWPGGAGRAVGRWIGVLMTAGLLALGAPFWFDRLRDLAGLRDRLKPPPAPAPSAGGAAEPRG